MLLHSMFAVTQMYHLLLLFLSEVCLFLSSVLEELSAVFCTSTTVTLLQGFCFFFFPSCASNGSSRTFSLISPSRGLSVPCGPWVTKIVSSIEPTSLGERHPVFGKYSPDRWVQLCDTWANRAGSSHVFLLLLGCKGPYFTDFKIFLSHTRLQWHSLELSIM